jgi:kynurenine formamidase
MGDVSRRKFLGMTGASLALASSSCSSAAPRTTAAVPAIQTDADMDRLLPALSNWGRWGEDDRFGTLNFITPAKRQAAARQVQRGQSVSLARTTSLADIDRGVFEMDIREGGALDYIGMRYHGYAMTHLDALGHVFADEVHLYNGLPRTLVTEAGVKELGVELLGQNGVVGRGVLLDIAGLQGGPLQPGTAIFPAGLDAAATAQGVQIESGDILLVRTGAGRDNTWEQRAGLHPECLPWLHDREIAMLGCDGDSDVWPLPGFEKRVRVMHSIGIPYLGMPLIDNAELDALSAACRLERRWSFLLTVAPLRLAGLTGSPVNPIALF